jgi:hypothetical protein
VLTQKLSSFARKLKRLKCGDVLIVLRVAGGFVQVPRHLLPKDERRKGKRA